MPTPEQAKPKEKKTARRLLFFHVFHNSYAIAVLISIAASIIGAIQSLSSLLGRIHWPSVKAFASSTLGEILIGILAAVIGAAVGYLGSRKRRR